MNPQLQRMLPFLLILVFAFILIPTLTHRSKKGGLSSSDIAAKTLDGMKVIQSGEQAFLAKHGRFTPHVADLVSTSPKLATDLVAGLDVKLDVSTDGRSYLAQVTSTVLSLVRAAKDTKSTAQSCVVLKSGSGVKCPAPSG